MSDAEQAVRLELSEQIATLIVDNPPVNALSAAVMSGLEERLRAAHADPQVVAIVLAGAAATFVAGADISRLQAIGSGAPLGSGRSLAAILPLVESGEKPTVAAIDGFALGGGLELAMACNARVGSTRCRVGLPELKLGLIPGAGGTQRLPRLVGVQRAVDMMLGSTQIDGRQARELGILDELVDPGSNVVERAQLVARELADGRRELRRALERDDRLEPLDDARRIIADARAAAAKKHRNVGYPDACLDAVLEGVEKGAKAGFSREQQLFRELLVSDAARGLIHVFFATRAAAKVPGVTDAGLTASPIERVGVLGGGTMGSGIATALVSAGVEVRLKEVDDAALEAGVARVRGNVERNVTQGRITREQGDATLARLRGQTDYAGFSDLDMVIEAATEKVELKQQIFRELAERTSDRAILASNTSSIDIEHLAPEGAAGRVLGTHFFSPAHIMKLVEVVRSAKTSPQTLLDTLGLAKKMKKTAVTVVNCPGFLINRVFMRYGQAAGWLIDRGVDPYRVDRALYDFGMPMGPNRMGDLAGLDVSVFAAGIMDAAYPDHAYRSALRGLLVEAGRLGEKSGSGHYRYEGRKAEEAPELAGFVARARELAGSPEPISPSDEEIVQMALFGVVNEACRAIEEGIVVRPGDIDVAAILGMGFPAYRGGPMKWADGIGARAVHDALADWRTRYGAALFEPSRLLAGKAKSSASLLD